MTGSTIALPALAAFLLASLTAAAPQGEPVPDCTADRLGGAAAPQVRAALLKAAGPRAVAAGDRWFTDNVVMVAPAGLNTQRHTLLAYVSGRRICGSGGCNAYVLAGSGTGTAYSTVARIVPARLPISRLPAVHHGWHDLGVPVAGGGVRQGHVAALAFDGRGYAGNPTLRAVPRATDAGEVVLGLAGTVAAQCRLR